MNKQMALFTIESVKRLDLSINGNPKRALILIDADGNIHHAKTATDAACGYDVDYYSVGETFLFIYHCTKNGAMIIDYIRKPGEDLYKAFTAAGWRERYAMQHGKREYITMANGERVIKFTYSRRAEYQDANGAVYSINRGAWIN